ncbi:MAG: thioredoxin family protein [Phycisphaerae bacterium]
MRRWLREHGCLFTLFALAGLSGLLGTGCQQAQTSNLTYQPTGTPRLVELGTAACIPCALMRPGLDELKAQYAGRLEVEVIDTLYDPGAKTQYKAPFCATQIYIAASGKELYRHVGYASKEEILANWRRLGVDLTAPPPRQ